MPKPKKPARTRAKLQRRFLKLVARCSSAELDVVIVGMDVVATMGAKPSREYRSALLGELSRRAPWALDALDAFWGRMARRAS